MMSAESLSALIKRVAAEIISLSSSTVFWKLAQGAKFNTNRGERIIGLERLISPTYDETAKLPDK